MAPEEDPDTTRISAESKATDSTGLVWPHRLCIITKSSSSFASIRWQKESITTEAEFPKLQEHEIQKTSITGSVKAQSDQT